MGVVQEALPPLSQEQQGVLDAVLAGRSLFFSGCAGACLVLFSQTCSGPAKLAVHPICKQLLERGCRH